MAQLALVVILIVFGVSGYAWSSESGIPDGITRNNQATASDIKNMTLTLDTVLRRTLADNPALTAFAYEVKVREFETRQAGIIPNPELSFEVANIGGDGEYSGTGSAETTFSVSQLVELGGKRAQRMNVGQLRVGLAQGEYESLRFQVMSEAAKQFYSVLAVKRKLGLANEKLRLNKKTLTNVQERIATGKAAEIEQFRFQTLVSVSELQYEQAQRNFDTEIRTLARYWGSETIDFNSVVGDLEQINPVPAWEEMISGLAQSPLMRRLEQAVLLAAQQLQLEKTKQIPDVTLSLGVKNDRTTSDNAIMAGISVPIQFFDRNQHMVAVAQSRETQVKSKIKAELLQLKADLYRQWQQLHFLYREVTTMRDQIIPALQRAYDGMAYGYLTGKFGSLEVLDAERELSAAKENYIDSLLSYQHTVATIEQRLGRSLDPRADLTAQISLKEESYE
ncbi:MAG: TolC family protein [Desulfuromonadales bacterium]|nr:TolC family protein [Desulfuromonadales bacterium]MDT8422204.1 TolC family protein [Desulfuromonadales bacterium]